MVGLVGPPLGGSVGSALPICAAPVRHWLKQIVALRWSQWQPLHQEGSDNFPLVCNVPEGFWGTEETTFLCEEGALYTLTCPKMSQGCSVSVEEVQSWWEVPAIAHFCSLFRTAFRLPDFEIEVTVCLRRLAATRMSFNTEIRSCLCQHFCLRDRSVAFGTSAPINQLMDCSLNFSDVNGNHVS